MGLSGATDPPIERIARALYDLAVDGGEQVAAEWDFGPAEYMRYLFKERAKAAVEAVGTEYHLIPKNAREGDPMSYAEED